MEKRWKSGETWTIVECVVSVCTNEKLASTQNLHGFRRVTLRKVSVLWKQLVKSQKINCKYKRQGQYIITDMLVCQSNTPATEEALHQQNQDQTNTDSVASCWD